MSQLLEAAARLDPQRCADLAANDAAAGHLRAYRILIGPRDKPRLDFGCMAYSSFAAIEQHVELCEPGERVEVIAVGDNFAVKTELHALEEALLRDVRRKQ